MTDIPPPGVRRKALEQQYANWVPGTLAQHLDAVAANHPDRPLVILDDRQITYREMADWSWSLARGLVSLGLHPGDHVALLMANFPEFVALKFAIARIGAVAVPINFLLRANELAYILKQSDAKLLVTMDAFGDRNYLDDLDAISPDWIRSGGGAQCPDLRHVVVFTTGSSSRSGITTLETLQMEDSPALSRQVAEYNRSSTSSINSDIVYTSGTTGSPKGVMLEHHMVLRAAYASSLTSAFEDGRRILFALPMYHVFGYVECLIASTFAGGAIIPHLTFDAGAMVDAAERHRATEIICVPLMTMKILDVVKARGFDNTHLITMFNSGGASPPQIWQDIRSLLGARELLTAYGMSETTASTTCTHPEAPDRYLLESNGRLKFAGVAGDPDLNGVLAIYRTIDPETGEVLPWGMPGELIVKGPIVTKGYYRKPQETAAAFFADGWLKTGDLGTITEDGYLRLTGRVKETYRCGGEMVMPKEVEDVLNLHPSVAQSYVVGIKDVRLGEVGCACIVRSPQASASAEELRELCAKNLAKFKVPKFIVFVEAKDIPMTATGRPQKFKLAEFVSKTLLN